MSFLRVKKLLPRAFKRFDRKHTLELNENKRKLEAAVKELFPKYNDIGVVYRNGTITIYSSSQALKQKIFLSKAETMEFIRKRHPEIVLKDLVFKGPQ